MRIAHDGGVDDRTPPSPGEPGAATLLVFSAPMLVIVGIELAWRVYLPAHLGATFGMSLAAVGTLLLAARLFDMAADPVVAWASDRFATRWGHRRPWMVAAVPPILIGLAGLFFLPPATGMMPIVAAAAALHLGYTLLATPHGGWAIELARTPAGRMRVMTARTWVALLGMVVLLAVPSILERGIGADRATQTRALAAALLLLTPVAVLLTLRFVAEPPPLPGRRANAGRPWRSFATVLAIPALWPVLSLYLLSGIAEAGSAAIFLRFVDHGLDLGGWGSSLLLVQAAVTVVALPFWGRAGPAIGNRTLLTLFYGWQLLVAPLALFVPAGSVVATGLFVAARGVVAGVDFLVLRAMVADVSGTVRAQGVQAGATCYSVGNMTLRLGMGIGPLLAFAGLGAAGTTAVPGPAGGDALLRLTFVLSLMLPAALGLAVVWLRGRHVVPAPWRAREAI